MTDDELATALAGILGGIRSTSRFALEAFVRAALADGVNGAQLGIHYKKGEPLEVEVSIGQLNAR